MPSFVTRSVCSFLRFKRREPFPFAYSDLLRIPCLAAAMALPTARLSLTGTALAVIITLLWSLSCRFTALTPEQSTVSISLTSQLTGDTTFHQVPFALCLEFFIFKALAAVWIYPSPRWLCVESAWFPYDLMVQDQQCIQMELHLFQGQFGSRNDAELSWFCSEPAPASLCYMSHPWSRKFGTAVTRCPTSAM